MVGDLYLGCGRAADEAELWQKMLHRQSFQLLDAVQRGRFVGAVRDFVGCGGDYYGGSAGAVLACESIAIADGQDPNEVGLSDLTGLGLISGVAVWPHFTHDQLGRAQDWSRTHQITVLGLPETSGLHCHDTTAEITGTGPLFEIGVDVVREHTPGQRLHLAR